MEEHARSVMLFSSGLFISVSAILVLGLSV
jgi:hypothetical protein